MESKRINAQSEAIANKIDVYIRKFNKKDEEKLMTLLKSNQLTQFVFFIACMATFRAMEACYKKQPVYSTNSVR